MMAAKIKNLRFSREIRPTPPILFGWRRGGWRGDTVRDLFLVCYLLIGSVPFAAHAQELPPTTDKQKALAVPAPPAAPAGQQPLPINLPTALQLANAQALDVAIASQRIEVALAQLQRAQRLWLPTIYLGTDYYRHDGQIQETPGPVFGASRSSFMAGAGPSAGFAERDAISEPLGARDNVRAREAAFQTASNDILLAVADAYFGVQQARGELA